MNRVRSLTATVLVTLMGTGALWWGTDGLQAFTAEAARRTVLLDAPRELPAASLEDQDGRSFSLQDYRGKLLAVEFIYTRCPTLCRSMGMAFRQIHDHVPAAALEKDFALLSISFDTARDDTASLRNYGRTYGADGNHWRIARVPSDAELKQLLKAFGVVVIDDGLGGFEHNAAIHLLDRGGRLALISDIDEPLEFAEKVVAWL
ncbi:MAG TPA: SCO family protein [Gallionella sp.]|nr:SCO family protein [Gallionella sp.]